jgi:hypothetical protein
VQYGCINWNLLCVQELYKMGNTMLDISLEYALSQCDEKTIDTILATELSQEEKKEILMKQNEVQKRIILQKIGFKKEFLKTI